MGPSEVEHGVEMRQNETRLQSRKPKWILKDYIRSHINLEKMFSDNKGREDQDRECELKQGIQK